MLYTDTRTLQRNFVYRTHVNRNKQARSTWQIECQKVHGIASKIF